jgi:Fur family transcriptional regulator, peroxide stress response regulator
MKYDGKKDETQAILHIFQQHRLKVTPQRVAIYQALRFSSTHPTADAIYQMVKKQYPHISFDTVNRTLLTLAKIGIVEIIEIFGGAKRFDPNVSNHHHLHCTQCGEVTDFENQAYDELNVPVDIRENFKVTSKRIVLRGICNACLS